jgi:TetR/AcrR family transcriptional regulator, regulator of autoinduction and epiphytic fitness
MKAMDLIPQRGRSRPGRPTAQRAETLERQLLGTAAQLFAEQGYAATSMEQIALVAGIGKQTIYRRYPSKEILFTAVLCDMSRDILQRVAVDNERGRDPLLALRETCRAALELFGTPSAVAMHRLLIAEAPRFPSLIERVTREVIEPIDAALRRLIEAAQRTGQLRADWPAEDALRALSGMTIGWLVQRKLLGLRSLATEAERTAFFGTMWSLFVKGTTAP